ncbi:MAG: glycoside hydrolase family 2 TIM barrel-domain containing protein [Chthoniobacteraceae bacterium]
MKFRRFILAGIFLLAASTVLHAQRQSINLASGWKFIKQDVGLAAATGAWENVTVPHTWNAQDAQLGKAGNPQLKDGYYRGACWYALPLDIPAAWKGRRVFIRFEAAALVSKTYLNGELLGEHRGGFTAFCYELTPHLHFGVVNDLRVQVDNSHQEDVPPLSGDFNIDGGIYRPVALIVTAPVSITPLDFASPGVYLTTKFADKAKATVEIKSLISNSSDSPAKVIVESEIKDATGKSVCTISSAQSIGANETGPVVQTLVFPSPHLWNGRKDPYLYSATVRVIRDGKKVDEVSQPLGLRTLAISQEQGFLLNGEPYPIYGVNRHQDRIDKGWALSPADHEADARIILDMGTTAIRLAHYPQSEYFHGLCDRNGLLLWNEVSLVNTISDTPAFAANAELQLRELILQRYNHPSAAFWGTFNELENQKTPPPDALLQHLKDVIHELDPSRIDVGASDHNSRAYNRIPTAICFNSYPGWYGKGMPDDMAKYIDERAKEVGKRIALSEFGGGGNPFQHQEGPPQKIDQKGQFHPEEWQAFIHEREWRIIQGNPNLWGSFLWVIFDFPSAGRNEGGHPGLNDKGLVSQDRKIKKDAYFFYKANWNPEPMVYIASRRSTPRKLASTEVKVYSNCAEVELIVNGKSLGRMKPDETKIARWPDAALQPGKNHIEAVAVGALGKITDSCDWTLAQIQSAY